MHSQQIPATHSKGGKNNWLRAFRKVKDTKCRSGKSLTTYFSIFVISLTCFLKPRCFSGSGFDAATLQETKSKSKQQDKKEENLGCLTDNILKAKESTQNKEEDVTEK